MRHFFDPLSLGSLIIILQRNLLFRGGLDEKEDQTMILYFTTDHLVVSLHPRAMDEDHI